MCCRGLSRAISQHRRHSRQRFRYEITTDLGCRRRRPTWNAMVGAVAQSHDGLSSRLSLVGLQNRLVQGMSRPIPTYRARWPDYVPMWDHATVLHSDVVLHVAKRLVAAKDRYLIVEKKTGVPWWWIAPVHERESS